MTSRLATSVLRNTLDLTLMQAMADDNGNASDLQNLNRQKSEAKLTALLGDEAADAAARASGVRTSKASKILGLSDAALADATADIQQQQQQ